MNPHTNKILMDRISDSIDEAKAKPMTEKEGYQWGLEYLQNVKKELLKLEARAMTRNDPLFFNDVRFSMLRALEAEEELEEKIKTC